MTEEEIIKSIADLDAALARMKKLQRWTTILQVATIAFFAAAFCLSLYRLLHE